MGLGGGNGAEFAIQKWLFLPVFGGVLCVEGPKVVSKTGDLGRFCGVLICF